MNLYVMLANGKDTYLYGTFSTQVNNLSEDSGFLYGYTDKDKTKDKRINLRHVAYVEEID